MRATKHGILPWLAENKLAVTQTDTITVIVPAGGSFTYNPDPTPLQIADHAITPLLVTIVSLVCLFRFSRPLSDLIRRIKSAEGFGVKAEIDQVGPISKGAFHEKDPLVGNFSEGGFSQRTDD